MKNILYFLSCVIKPKRLTVQIDAKYLEPLRSDGEWGFKLI